MQYKKETVEERPRPAGAEFISEALPVFKDISRERRESAAPKAKSGTFLQWS